MNERAAGGILCSLSVVFMFFYTWLLFLPPPDWRVLDKPLTWWALALPVYVLVFAFFGILIWIGWAMATTPEEVPLTTGSPPVGAERRQESEKGP